MRVSDQTLRYNCKDAGHTLECYEDFFSEIDKPAYRNQPTFRDTYDHTIELFGPCMFMATNGLKVNHESLQIETKRVGKRIEELQIDINKACGEDINPLSPKQLQAYFYVKLGIPPYTKLNAKKQSRITCDDRALQRLARGTSNRKGRPEAKLIQEFKNLSKLKGTYLDMTFDKDDRLRCDYKPRGTRFARLSSTKTIFDTGMNLQNLDPRFLSFLEADDDKFFVALDKSQAEWVVVAYDSGDAAMISAIERGLDVHLFTASRMFHQEMELIDHDNDLIGHHSDPALIKQIRMADPLLRPIVESGEWLPRTMSMRQCGKKSNHGLNYDESANMFGLTNEITLKESKVVVDFYHTTYPGIRKRYESIRAELTENGRVLTNLFGRPYRFSGKFDTELFKSAYSFIPQSTVGELINRGMCDIYYSSSPALTNVEISQQVHDDIKFQLGVNDRGLGQTVHELRDCIDPELHTNGRDFKIGTDLTVGYDLGNLVKVPLVSDPDNQTQLIRNALDGCKRSG